MILNNKEFIICKDQYRFGFEKINIENMKNTIKKKKKGSFIILDEEIYIKQYDTTKISEIKTIINDKIKKEFNSDNYLIHFCIDNKEKKTFIYAIKGGDRLMPFLDYLNKIKVTPIQFLMLKNIRKNIKKRNFKALIEIKDKHYYIEVKNNIIIKNLLFSIDEKIIEEKDIIKGKFDYPFKYKNLIIEEV